MHLQQKFTRTAAGGTWTADVLPNAGTLGFGTGSPGQGPGSAAPTDCVVNVVASGPTGLPVRRIAVGYMSAPDAKNPYLAAELWGFDKNTGYYVRTGGPRALRLGRLVYFDIATMSPGPPKSQATALRTNSIMDGGIGGTIGGGGDYFLLVTPPPSGLTAGAYEFAMGGCLSVTGPDDGAPFDDAVGLQLVTPSDTLALPFGPCRWLWVGNATAGQTLAVNALDDAQEPTFAGKQTLTLPAFAGKVPVRAAQVFATGTTATAGSIFAAY
jgi:hypothetical protein